MRAIRQDATKRNLMHKFALLPLAVLALLLALPATAQSGSSQEIGRISLFLQGGNSSALDGSGPGLSFSDGWAYFTLHSPAADAGGLEYGLDTRGSSYGRSGERDTRFQLYEGYVGARIGSGVIGGRLGQMWINELGALGSVGGVLLEARPKKKTKLGRARLGLFGGLEPKWIEAGYTRDVRKGGAYVILEGEGARRHTLGYVLMRTGGLTERSVIVFNNFVPVGQKFFLYQSLEYDLSGPGGNGSGGLNYFFATARYAPSRRVEFQGTLHRGRSLDSRTITQDTINGRPVSAAALAGYVFESMGARVSGEVVRGVRVWGGYSREKNNRDDSATNRLSAGLSVFNLAESGVDVTLSGYYYQRPSGPYNSWYVSIGRNLSRKIYLSADFSTALSVVRFLPSTGIAVETRPQSRRFTLNSNIFLDRHFSIILTGEYLKDDYTKELRGLLGLTYRF
jgi:hypothetical protein